MKLKREKNLVLTNKTINKITFLATHKNYNIQHDFRQ